MASKNVETVMRAHQLYNTRKLQEGFNEFADGSVYHDLPRGKDWTKAELGDFLAGWIRAFDSQIADARYIDAGDVVVVEFKVRGTNDGPLGSFPPTHKQIELPYCEVVRFDPQGKIQEVTAYYDLLALLSRLGHLRASSEAERGAPAP